MVDVYPSINYGWIGFDLRNCFREESVGIYLGFQTCTKLGVWWRSFFPSIICAWFGFNMSNGFWEETIFPIGSYVKISSAIVAIFFVQLVENRLRNILTISQFNPQNGWLGDFLIFNKFEKSTGSHVEFPISPTEKNFVNYHLMNTYL